jgi:Protein of unknown function (DUF1499)
MPTAAEEHDVTDIIANEPPMVDPVTAKIDPPVLQTESVAVAPKTTNYSGKAIFWLGLASPIVALGGALGSAWGFWDFGKGFLALAGAFVLAFMAVAMGFGVGARNRKKGVSAPKLHRFAGMAIGIGMIGWLSSLAFTAFTVAPIHDISTDLADPPQFQTLVLRADNWDAIPGANDAGMKGMTPQQRWEVIHRGAYGDVRTVRISEPVVDVLAKAERLAKNRGWDIAISDSAKGRLEATAVTRFFGFKDDVVVRVRATEDGQSSLVDMRSVSRVGVSDLGANAKRVRSFLADLAGTVSAG